jgi:predicted ArsR family transcriptional regulator
VERDPQKVSAVLADPTRYQIYQHVLTAPCSVTVAGVAREFGLHPNVARMHLGKLVGIGLLNARAEKTGKGGRPGNLYAPSGHAVSLSVPARDFQLLADLLVQSLALMGEDGKEAITQIGRTFGQRLGREAVERSLAGPDHASAGAQGQEEILRTCAEALERLGVATHVNRRGDGAFSLVLRTCGFQEVAAAHPEHVCHLCKAMVEGITQTCLAVGPTVTQAASVPRGDRECVYDMDGPLRLEE